MIHQKSHTPVKRAIVQLSLGVLLASGCSQADDQSAVETEPAVAIAEIEGIEWRLERFGADDAVPSETAITATLSDGGVVGSSGCNRYTGSYTSTDTDPISIEGPFAGTRMACPPPADTLETRYLEALDGIDGFRLESGKLVLEGGPEGSLTFGREAASDIRGEEVTYEVAGAEFTGYLAYDASVEGTRPGVLVVHEWWGHNDYVRRRARMLAEMGYTAFALDMYGTGKLAEHPQDAQKFMTEVMQAMDVGVARFRAAHELLGSQPTVDPERIAAIGYCFGGAVVLHMARLGEDLDAVASFHGDLSTQHPAEAGAVSSRVLVLHGADDPFVPAESIGAFEAEMESAGVDMRFVSYPGAVHSFTNPDATAVGEEFGMPLAYDEEADGQSWQELERFLAETFDG